MKISKFFKVLGLTTVLTISSSAMWLVIQNKSVAQHYDRDGHDPYTDHCVDQYTRTVATRGLEEKEHGGNVLGQVNLRYSPTCETKWVQVQVVGDGIKNLDLVGTVRFTGDLRRLGELPVFKPESFNNPQGNTMYTDMVDASLDKKVFAEGQIDGVDSYGTHHRYLGCINEANREDPGCPALVK